MAKLDLAPLVIKAQAGDQDALNDLLSQCYETLYYYAYNTVKDEELAADITQESCIEIINTIKNLREPKAFLAWTRKIVTHKCSRYFKQTEDEVDLQEDEGGKTVLDDLPDERRGSLPEQLQEDKEFQRIMWKMLDSLPAEQRQALLLHYMDELTVQEIAEIQGKTVGTVKSRLNYGRKAVIAQVNDYEKKNNVKLHSIAPLPLLLYFLFRKNMVQVVADAAATLGKVWTGITGAVSAAGTAAVATAATGTVAAGVATTGSAAAGAVTAAGAAGAAAGTAAAGAVTAAGAAGAAAGTVTAGAVSAGTAAAGATATGAAVAGTATVGAVAAGTAAVKSIISEIVTAGSSAIRKIAAGAAAVKAAVTGKPASEKTAKGTQTSTAGTATGEKTAGNAVTSAIGKVMSGLTDKLKPLFEKRKWKHILTTKFPGKKATLARLIVLLLFAGISFAVSFGTIGFYVPKRGLWHAILDAFFGSGLLFLTAAVFWGMMKWICFIMPKAFRWANKFWRDWIPLSLFGLYIKACVWIFIVALPVSLCSIMFSPLLAIGMFLLEFDSNVFLALGFFALSTVLVAALALWDIVKLHHDSSAF